MWSGARLQNKSKNYNWTVWKITTELCEKSQLNCLKNHNWTVKNHNWTVWKSQLNCGKSQLNCGKSQLNCMKITTELWKITTELWKITTELWAFWAIVEKTYFFCLVLNKMWSGPSESRKLHWHWTRQILVADEPPSFIFQHIGRTAGNIETWNSGNQGLES